ncbi:hypothetical protein [Paraburkholderia caribensis]|uniref:hypothetical protein n=1 Tax=Paraburkholderia caribensis TaxID=75105 RepID=UPI00078DA0AE|nr:hypothetical protein [Paraburkholderia caribensis]AMV48170.1 hypothetical protein ATN79_46740 [Paraburkholderia caribensis]
MEEHHESAVPQPIEVIAAVEDISLKYVAFCDILGFSNKIATDFDETLKVYRQFGERLEPSLFGNVRMTMYSDAILLTSDELFPLLSAIQVLWFIALTENLMLRGGIAYGKYWERRQGDHMMVVSDALVRAVKIEGMVGVPAVVLADDINLDLGYWVPRFRDGKGQYMTPILHFRDRNIVNPFSPYWGVSAQNRARMLMEESPAHKEKYLWFLALYNAVAAGEKLVPETAFAQMISEGIIGPAPSAHDQANP